MHRKHHLLLWFSSYADCEAYVMERIRLCAEYIVHKKDRCFAGS